jgi:hypothetical protein
VEDKGEAYSQPSLSATDIIPRAITGRAREVPSRYTFCNGDQLMITARGWHLLRRYSLLVQQGRLTASRIHASSPAILLAIRTVRSTLLGFQTSKKNFFAPTLSAFFLAASKSCANS